jgi:hypothetical protein
MKVKLMSYDPHAVILVVTVRRSNSPPISLIVDLAEL